MNLKFSQQFSPFGNQILLHNVSISAKSVNLFQILNHKMRMISDGSMFWDLWVGVVLRLASISTDQKCEILGRTICCNFGEAPIQIRNNWLPRFFLLDFRARDVI